MNKFTWVQIAALSGFLCVAIGAFAAHGLKHILDAYALGIIDTGIKYQMFHTLVLLILPFLAEKLEFSFNFIGWAFVTGILLFSGSLYALAMTGIKGFAFLTPIGGTIWLFAWITLAVKVGTKKKITNV
ncbi:DUF423 domain-containing protein [Glaciecola sp. 1036]|uniref:DUF423 domain-containing protein n=1 Tax=Alteromonadaceae TaxID=72275 RepID=UPI003CFE6826